MWPGAYPYWQPPSSQSWGPPPQYSSANNGVLGSRPQFSGPRSVKYEPTVDFAQAFNTMTLTDPTDNQWYMDSGATAHLSASAGNLHSVFNLGIGNSVTVANGSRIPIQSSGSLSFPSLTRPLSLNSILITPSIIKNLVSVRRFVTDNSCSIEFDPFGFSVKDLQTRQIILRSDSTGDLYPVFPTASTSSLQPIALHTFSSDTWHRRLAHLGNDSLKFLISNKALPCNKNTIASSCTVCKLGKPIKSPFFPSQTVVQSPFEIVHSDLWTSPVQSVSGIRYYVLFLDHYSHFLWVYPLRRKSEVFDKFVHFSNYVRTQFKREIQALQCDNGGEYNNTRFHEYFASTGTMFRFSCPHSSQQNGKSERMIHTINNAIRCLLFQAHLPSSFWVEALHTAVHILNLLPTTAINNKIPFSTLFNKPISYSHLKVFGCLCFPNINYNNLSKLSPRSAPCLFLGYPTNHRGYRCFDLKSKKIIISRHVSFDENVFPYLLETSPKESDYQFLHIDDETSSMFQQILESPLVTPNTNIVNDDPTPSPPTPPPPPPPTPPSPPPSPQKQKTVRHRPPPPKPTMTTRSKLGIRKPKKIISLHTQASSQIPNSHLKALFLTLLGMRQ